MIIIKELILIIINKSSVILNFLFYFVFKYDKIILVIKMVYLDYSATTPVNKEVLDSFDKVSLNFIGNPNSLHKLGVESKKLIDEATNQIADILKISSEEIIYTSGASESNNTALKGICFKYKNRGNHIITTKLEHSSIYGALGYLQKNGFVVDFVNLLPDGKVDLDDLKNKLTDETILVSISHVNSEIGILQDINQIGKIIHENSKAYFHVDMTQSIGKVRVSFENVDLASFTAHKIYGLKGIGALYLKKGIVIDNLIHGGKSTSIYRSGTPSCALIVSFAKALRLIYNDIDIKYSHVLELNNYIRNNIDVPINSTNASIPHILNISVLNIKPETVLHALEKYDIYISTQSACSTGDTSTAVYAVTNDLERAKHSIRISLSYLTSMDEVIYFVKCFKEVIDTYGK